MIGRLSNKISRTLEKSNENPTLETSKVIKNKKRKLDDSISSLDLEIKSKNEVSNEEGLKKKMKKVKRQSVDGLEMTPIQDKSKSKMKFKKEKDVKMKDNASKLTKKSDNSKSTPETALYNSKTVYIEGLPFTATDEMVIEFFEVTHSVGSVKEVRLPRWHDSGRLRGYGHVEFVKESSVDKALELTGKYLNDRYLKIEKPLPPKEIKADRSEVIVPPGGCNTIFVKNLPYDVDEEAFQKEFQVFGPINSIRLPRWGHTNQLKGFGYVVFKRPESAEIAVKKSKGLGQNGGSGVVLNNRTLVIDFETGAPKMSFESIKMIFIPKQGTSRKHGNTISIISSFLHNGSWLSVRQVAPAFESKNLIGPLKCEQWRLSQQMQIAAAMNAIENNCTPIHHFKQKRIDTTGKMTKHTSNSGLHNQSICNTDISEDTNLFSSFCLALQRQLQLVYEYTVLPISRPSNISSCLQQQLKFENDKKNDQYMNFECISNYQQFNYDLYYITNQSLDLSTEQFKIYLDENINKVLKIDLINKKINRKNISGSESNSFVCYTSLIILFEYMNHWWKLQLANIDSTLKYSTRNRMDELFVYCFKTYILNQGNKEKLLLSLLKNLGGSSASAQSNNNPGNGNQKHLSKTQENDIAKLLSATVSCLSYVLYLEELCNSSSNASKVLVAYCVTECNWNSEANAVSNTEAAVIMGGNILNGNNVSQLIRLCLSKSIYPTGDAKRTYESQKDILSNSTSSMQALSVEVLSCRLGLSTLLSHPAMIDKSNPVSEIATKECIHVFVRKWTRRLHDMAIGVYRNRNNPVHNSNDGGNMYEYVPTFRQATDGDLQCLKNEQRSCCGAGSSVQLLPILDQHSSLVLNQSIQNTIVNVFNVLLDLIESNDMFTEEVVVEICKFQSIHTQPVSKEDTFDMHLDYLSVLGLYMLGYCGNNKAEENVQVKQEHAIKRCTNSVGDAKENWIMYGSMEVSLSSSKVVGYLLTNGLVSKSKLARKAWYQVTVENVCNVVNQIRKTSGEGGRGVEDLNEHILSDITNKHLTAHGANPAKYNTNPKKNLVRDGDAQNMLYEHCLAIYLPLLGELFNQLVPHPDSTGCSRNTEDCDSTHIHGLCSFSKALFTILRYMLCRRGNSHSNQNISNRLIAICLYLLARLNNCQISEGRENENLSDFEDALTPWATHGKARTAPLFEYDKYKEEQEHNDQPVDMSYVNNVHADNTHCIMTCNVQSTPMDLRNAGSGSVLHLHLKEHARGMRALVALHQKDIQDILELKPWNDPMPHVLKSQYGFGNEVFKHPHSMTEDLEQYLSELMESRGRINYEEDMCGVATLKSNVDGSADCNQSIAHTNTMSNIESDPNAQMISNHCNSPGLSLIGRVSESMLYPTTPYSMSQALDQPAETFGCSGMVSTKQSPSSSMTPNGKSSMHPSLIAPFQLPEECDEPAAVLSPLVISNKEIKPDIVEEEMLCGDDETTFYDATRGRSSLQRATEEMTSASISIEVPVEMPPNRDTLARMEGDGLEENVEQNMVITDPSPAPFIPHSVPCEDNLEILDINKSLYAQLAKSQQQCEELKLQNTTLKFEACNDQKRIALLENENRILHEKISDGQNERIAYEIRNKDMHSKIDGLEKLLQDTYGKLQVLAKDEANRLSEYSILKEQLALKNTLLIKTQSELSTLETRNCSNNATITEMNTFFQQLLQEKNQAYNEKLEIKRQVDGVLIENNYFKQQIASYMDECKNVKLHVMELKSHISCLEEKNKVLHYDLDRNQQKISDLQNVNDDLNSALKQHVLKIKELELSAVESRGNIEMLESEKEQLQCTIVESNDKLDELRDQSDSLLEKLHEKNEECSRLSLALSNSQEELKKHQDLMNLINKISKNKDIESILSK